MIRSLAKSLPFLVSLFVTSCGKQETRLETNIKEPPNFETLNIAAMQETDDPVLARGRQIYLENCDRCHRNGKAGAPPTGDKTAWGSRIAKGIAQLEKHALEGHEGPAGTEMPARGGNPELSDSNVIEAVHFMISLIRIEEIKEIEHQTQATE